MKTMLRNLPDWPQLQLASFVIALALAIGCNMKAGELRVSSADHADAFNQKQSTEAPGSYSRSAPTAVHFLPEAVYQIDDGTAEDATGFGDGTQNFEAIWFNQFPVVPGNERIWRVSVAWGTPTFLQELDGTPVQIGIWSDPNGDGNPSDAVLLGSVSGTIQNANTNTFVDYFFNPVGVDVSAYTSFFIGDMTPMNHGPELFYQSLDVTLPRHRQSWVAGMSTGGPVDFNNLGNNDFIGLIDDFGVPGNWLVRADPGGCCGPPLLLSAASRLNHGADAGDFDINMPLEDPVGIEDRSSTIYNAILTFNVPVSSADVTVVAGTATVGTPVFSGNQIVVSLFEVADIQIVTLNVANVNGISVGSFNASFGFLIGDVDGDGRVARPDCNRVRRDKQQAVTDSTFREDINLNGVIDRPDLSLVKASRNHRLP